jgi:hypothetical protein
MKLTKILLAMCFLGATAVSLPSVGNAQQQTDTGAATTSNPTPPATQAQNPKSKKSSKKSSKSTGSAPTGKTGSSAPQ